MWRLLEPLRTDDREAFLALARRRTFARDEVVCHEDDPADSLHLVEHGHLAVRGRLASGATATFTILSAGDYFGELALLRADRRRTATVVALEPSRTLSVAAKAFDAVCRRNPGVERIVATLLADLVGAPRPSVNQVLQRLAELEVVRLGRARIEILAPAWLESRCRR